MLERGRGCDVGEEDGEVVGGNRIGGRSGVQVGWRLLVGAARFWRELD